MVRALGIRLKPEKMERWTGRLRNAGIGVDRDSGYGIGFDLRREGYEDELPYLAWAIRHPQKKIREEAFDVLKGLDFGKGKLPAKLRTALIRAFHRFPMHRGAAARLLSSAERPPVKTLMHALDLEHPPTEVMDALAQMGHRPAWLKIAKALGPGTYDQIHSDALKAIIQLRDPRAVPTIEKHIDRLHFVHEKEVGEILADWAHPKTIPIVMKLIGKARGFAEWPREGFEAHVGERWEKNQRQFEDVLRRMIKKVRIKYRNPTLKDPEAFALQYFDPVDEHQEYIQLLKQIRADNKKREPLYWNARANAIRAEKELTANTARRKEFNPDAHSPVDEKVMDQLIEKTQEIKDRNSRMALTWNLAIRHSLNELKIPEEQHHVIEQLINHSEASLSMAQEMNAGKVTIREMEAHCQRSYPLFQEAAKHFEERDKSPKGVANLLLNLAIGRLRASILPGLKKEKGKNRMVQPESGVYPKHLDPENLRMDVQACAAAIKALLPEEKRDLFVSDISNARHYLNIWNSVDRN